MQPITDTDVRYYGSCVCSDCSVKPRSHCVWRGTLTHTRGWTRYGRHRTSAQDNADAKLYATYHCCQWPTHNCVAVHCHTVQIRRIVYCSAVALSSPMLQITADVRHHYRSDTIKRALAQSPIFFSERHTCHACWRKTKWQYKTAVWRQMVYGPWSTESDNA